MRRFVVSALVHMRWSRITVVKAVLLLTLVLLGGFGLRTSLNAQQPPVSPRDSVAARIDGSDITVVYGRPYVWDPRTGERRRIWGSLVPYGRVWRTGANEATVLTSTRDLLLAGEFLPAGSYSLFSIPEERRGRLIVNAQTGQWGTQRDEVLDLLQLPMTREPLRPPVDQFTVVIEPQPGGGGVIRFRWADAQYSIPFQVRR
jgi:hypothetical protein